MKRIVFACALLLAACGGNAPSPDTTYGREPQLPAPQGGGLPTVNPAEAVGWPDGAAPVAPAGFTVNRFAEGLDHPRWMYMLPNGDVLVAESSTEAQEGGGIMGWIRNAVQRRAGALHESPDRIILLRDADRDGVAEARHVFAEDLNQPFGIVLVGDYLYVANTDAVVRYRYTPNSVRAPGQPETILELPFNEGDNGHWTRNLIANDAGTKIYVTVGSVSNVADSGMEVEEGRAAIWEFNPDGSEARIYASGLRNPVGMAWAGDTGALWVAVNERDMLGDNLVPDYMTSVQDGGFYGWPYSYWGQTIDERVEPQRPDLVATALTPDYALGAHTASLGLFFYHYDAFPERYWNGAFVGQHGSWNRSERVGYKVVFVPFLAGVPTGASPEDFLTGFLNDRGQAQGRPVGVTMDQSGALLVADDVGNIIWRVANVDPPAPAE